MGPIGNLGDITLRALQVMREEQAGQHILRRLREGQSLALVSDAGTPVLSDPGFAVLRILQDEGFPVRPVPGASALTAALSVAALPTSRGFLFGGFLAPKPTARRSQLQKLLRQASAATLILYEAPHRLLTTLEMLREFAPARAVVLCRELTKRYETRLRGAVEDVLQEVQEHPENQKGEMVLLVDGCEAGADDGEGMVSALEVAQLLCTELAESRAAALAAKICGVPKKPLLESLRRNEATARIRVDCWCSFGRFGDWLEKSLKALQGPFTLGFMKDCPMSRAQLSSLELSLSHPTATSSMMALRTLLLVPVLCASGASCDAGNCAASSAALLQRQSRQGLSQILSDGDAELDRHSKEYQAPAGESLYGPDFTGLTQMEGRFDFTYDPAVYDPATYNGSQADVLALQKHMAEVMKMSLAALVGSGVQPNDINVQYLSETPTSPQGTCVFHFLCPLTTSPLILAHSMNQITGATLKSELEALATSSNIDPAPFQFQPADVVASYAVMSTSTPAATTYSAATSSQSGSDGTGDSLYGGGSDGSGESLYGSFESTVEGSFVLSYDATALNDTAAAMLQALGEAPLKTALTGLVGHGIKPDAIKLQVVPIMPSATPVLLQRNAGEIKIIFTFACASDLAAQIGSTLTQITDAGLSSAITDVFVKMGIDPAPRISVSYLAATWFAGTTATTTFVSVASSTTRISSGSDGTGDSLYGGGSDGSGESLYGSFESTVEGSFVLSYDATALNHTAAATLQALGEAPLKTALTGLVGHGIKPDAIKLQVVPIMPSATPVLLQRNAGEIKIIFTFACASDLAAQISSALAQSTDAGLSSAISHVFVKMGIDPAPRISVSYLAVTWFVGTTATATTTFATATTTTSRTYTLEDIHPCDSFHEFMPDSLMSDHGWCDMTTQSNISEFACTSAGCSAMGYPDSPYCYCETKQACTAANLTYKYHTCKDEMSAYTHGEYPALIIHAREKQSCDGVETTWSQNLGDALEWPARKCCKSWPKTLCKPNATLATPCKDRSDFLATAKISEGRTCMDMLKELWDDYKILENASSTGCGAAMTWGTALADWVPQEARQCCGSYPATVCDPHLKPVSICKAEADFQPESVMHEWCQSNSSQHAETREACRRLGGNWTKYTCAEHVKYFDAQMHKALNQAHDTDTCAGVDVYGQPLLDHIRWPAQKCCSSYPASVCDKHAVKMDPCKSKEDFLAHHTMHQWCHFDHPPRPEDCSHHCGSDCHCASRGPCEALNGTWKEETCGYVFDHLDMETHKMLQTASESETCEGTDLHGQSLAQWVLPYAQQCCASYPASVCDKGLVRMTPCKDEGDFKPSTVMHAHCDFKSTFPEASVCNAQPGCSGWENHCYCQTEEGCRALGATWTAHTCQDEQMQWDVSMHQVLQEAAAAGSCDGLDMWGQALSSAISYAAQTCCASTPATVCDPTAKSMTPCSSADTFTKDKVMYAWCDLYSSTTTPEASVCNAQEGCYGDVGWCHCEQQSGCEALNGTWTAWTCAQEVDLWRPEQHKLLHTAEMNGTCKDHELQGYRAEDMVSYPAMQCCSDFPKTLCHPAVQNMTPCLRKQDFLANKTRYSWCNLYPSPNATDCAAHGCVAHGDSWCECTTESSCTAAGGSFFKETCASEISWWAPGTHKGVEEAIQKGSCSGVNGQYGSIDASVDWVGGECCSTGKSVCQELAAR
ncbi:unnamed protein product [Effrenium voratum]|nr:unnamed protein product [Effrenium voratum]